MKSPLNSAPVDTVSPSLPVDACLATAAALNQACRCVSLDKEVLQRLFNAGDADYREIVTTRPHLFADSKVFVGEKCLARMAAVVAAIERVAALPLYQETVLNYAPAIARFRPKARGVCMGYDFHLDKEGPKLIEINTNAGGVLLNSKLIQAQILCGEEKVAGLADPTALERTVMDMFISEWRQEKGDLPLKTIAIVDVAPASQYLAPEFELFKALFKAHGIQAWIVDPAELEFTNGQLVYLGMAIDLVYNRLTDFYFEDPAHAALKAAYETKGAVITPHPYAHALYANKRNLILLSSPEELQRLGVVKEDIQLLAGCIPATREVTAQNAPEFWKERRQWFFKPAMGFGSRAAYRGDKLTQRVFAEIAAGGYIAQALVLPSERYISPEGEERVLKFDLRNYVYGNQVQLVAARLYQGQTTNFRTPAGGFAAVYSLPADSGLCSKKPC